MRTTCQHRVYLRVYCVGKEVRGVVRGRREEKGGKGGAER